MKRFALGIMAGWIGLLGSLTAAYAALAVFWPASFPAPPISRFAALDEKLRFLREHPNFDPHILAIGSSITWRQIAGTPFEKMAGKQHFLNGATVSLQIHQTRDLLDFYLDNYKGVQTVLVMAGLPDFDDCSTKPRTLLDREAAQRYVFDGWPAAYFYMRYFSPQRFVRTAMTLAGRQTPYTGDLFLDEYGSGPLQVAAERQRGLRYTSIETDPACVSELIQLSEDLNARGMRLVLVFPPMHPEYRRTYPSAIPVTCRIATEVEMATRSHNTQILLLHRDNTFGPEDFYDAFHLQYDAVRRLSVRLAEDIGNSWGGNMKNTAMAIDGPLRSLQSYCRRNEASRASSG